MKKVLFVLMFISMMLGSCAYSVPDVMALARYQRIITDIYGNVVAGASASVYATGTTNLSTVYSDAAGATPLANPLTSNATGRIQFYAADGTYDVTVSGTGITAWTDSGVQLFDGGTKFTSNILGPAYGGTGYANNAASIFRISGNFPLTATLTASTGVTFPTTGTLSTLAGVETLTNKTLTTPTIVSIKDSIGTAGLTIGSGGNPYVGIYKASPGYALDVTGEVNISSGSKYRINGTQIAVTDLVTAVVGTGSIVLATSPTIATPIITSLLDTNGKTYISSTATASAIDYLNITNGSAASPVIVLGAAGTDTNIHLELLPKGSTGYVGVGIASPAYYLDVNGDINIASGKVYRINGTQIALANLSDTFTGTGNGVKQTQPTLTTPIIASIKDTAGNVWFESNPTASAVNYLNAKNGIAANPALVVLGAAGASTNIDIELLPKGTGKVGILNASPQYALDVTGSVNITGTYYVNGAALALAGTSQISTLLDANGNEWFAAGTTTGAVNYIQAFNHSVGRDPYLISAGTDTNIGMAFYGKGSPAIGFTFGSSNLLPTLASVGLSISNDYSNASGTASGTDLKITRTEANIGSGTQLFFDMYLSPGSVGSFTNKGHQLTDIAGGALSSPAASTCGTTPVVATSSSDRAGYITLGSGSPTACTVTFSAAYSNAPSCVITPRADAKCYLSALTTALFTVTCDATFVGFSYNCIGIGGVK